MKLVKLKGWGQTASTLQLTYYMFIKYPKIKHLGHEDVEGILSGEVVVEEKIDGANTSIWLEDDEIKCGSRTRVLGDESFNGFVEYVKAHEGICELFKIHPYARLYGEWLVRHTISYNETAYKKFYLFDVLSTPDEFTEPEEEVDEQEANRLIVRQCIFLDKESVRLLAHKFKLDTPHVFGVFKNPAPNKFDELVGQTILGEKGEGIVIKNAEFINKWGDRVCAKIVTQDFKEQNGIVFGGNNKSSETYVEMKMVQKFMTLARVRKVMQKLQPQIEKKLDMEHTARIIKSVYHDMFEEEIWTFVKKHKKIDFNQLERLSARKSAKIYHDILNNTLSVAYEESHNL